MVKKTFRIIENRGQWTFHDPDGSSQIFLKREDVIQTALLRADLAIAGGERIRVVVQHDTSLTADAFITSF